MRDKSIGNKIHKNNIAFGVSLASERFKNTRGNSNIKYKEKENINQLNNINVKSAKQKFSTNVFNFSSSKLPFLLNQNKFSEKPSKIYQISKTSPFSNTNKHKTNFGYAYSSGSIPCRIIHGNIKLTLKWDNDPNHINFDPLLITCFEGLLETEHPYNFLSRECIKTLIDTPKACEKILPLMNKIIIPLRNALHSNIEFYDNLLILTKLSNLLKESFNSYLNMIVQQICKYNTNNDYKDKINELLRTFEVNGGADAFVIIKKKIPTFIGIHHGK